MAENPKKILMVIAPSNFRDEELFHPKKVLEKKGFEVKIASSKSGEIKGVMGGTAVPDFKLEEVRAEDFDAVVFIGGGGASVYFNDATAQNLAKDAFSLGKIVAAICIAPSTLANAGLLEGKNATSYSSEQGNLEAKGAVYSGANVTIDGKIITANGPAAAKEFGEKIAEALR